MKVTAKRDVIVMLSLTEAEARMLMGMVQNPMCDPDAELPDVADFRQQLFTSLKAAGVAFAGQ